MEMSLSPWTDFDKEKTILSYCIVVHQPANKKGGQQIQ
jgi:hypothetical protein